MKGNSYLAEALAWLIIIVPAALVALKVGFRGISWRIILVAAPLISWVVSFILFWIVPANPGSLSLLAIICGGMTMLPFIGFFSLIWLVKRFRYTSVTRFVAVMLVFTVLVLPLSACFRWLPEAEAQEIARKVLWAEGITEFEIRGSERTWAGWTVYAEIPQDPRYPIFLTRSGIYSDMRH